MYKLPFIEPERCGCCGRLSVLYDRRNQVCFACYHDLSPYSKQNNKKRNGGQSVTVPSSGKILDVRV